MKEFAYFFWLTLYDESLYVTTTYSGGRGGKIFRVPVGVKGAKLNR
jgi:hypothetical protein